MKQLNEMSNSLVRKDKFKEYIAQHQGESNSEIARNIVNDYPSLKFDTVRQEIGKIIRDSSTVTVNNKSKEAYIVKDNSYNFNSRKGHFSLSVEQVDQLFYEYSEHGLNKTQTEIINKYNLQIWEWNSIKNSLFLYKKSNIFSPYTVQNTPKDELESVINSKLNLALNDKLNIEHLYKKSVIKQAKQVIADKNSQLLSEQTFLTELLDELPKSKLCGAVPVNKKAKNRPINVFLSDLHNGARIEWLHLTPDYNPEKLKEIMNDIADEINQLDSKEVTLSFLGDLIESFTGLNHKTSWQSMEGGYYGAFVVKDTIELLENFISKVNNVKHVIGIGGNHDRGDSDSKIDYQGEIAGIIFYGLERILPNVIKVTYDHRVVSTFIDGIQYIIMHGHHGESKRNSSEIVLNYGNQHSYNLIVTGHVHSLNVKADTHLHRHMVCPPIFPGNTYSESAGWTSTTGFIIAQNNGKNKPTLVIHSIQ